MCVSELSMGVENIEQESKENVQQGSVDVGSVRFAGEIGRLLPSMYGKHIFIRGRLCIESRMIPTVLPLLSIQGLSCTCGIA